MIKSEERWQANCDICFKDFEQMGTKYIASYKVSIEADLKVNGWRIKGNKCYCPDCKDKIQKHGGK